MSNHPRRTNARRGFSVCYRGKTLLSTIDPVAQAERTAEAAPLHDSTLYFCPSPLFGYGLSRLLERIEAHKLDSAVLCVEADRELLALSLDGTSAALPSPFSHPRLSLLGVGGAGPEPGESAEQGAGRLCAFVRQRWGSRRFRRLEVLRFSGAWQLYPELYAALAEALRADIATDWANAMTLIKLGRRYARNFIRNLALIPRCPPVSALSFGTAPVLVLGAGPSLDGFLDTLGGRSLGERPYRIVCADTVIPSLKARNIRPDLVIALESQHWNLRDFVGAKGWGVPLAMDLSALPATARVLGGACYTFFTPWTGLGFFKRLEAAGLLPERFPPLGSVGLSAVAAALKLGAGPVIVCGVDFSFTADSYHARSTPGHREKLRGQNRFRGLLNQAAAFRGSAFAALSKSGQPVRSDPAMRNYRELFEREFSGETRLRDVEGSGLPLGIPALSPEEAAAILWNPSCPGADTGRPEKPGEAVYDAAKAAGLREIIGGELAALEKLRGILRGEAAPEKLEALLDFCDYLWAHFPECAAAARRPPGTDIVFLKRIRAEIEPFMGLLKIALAEIRRDGTLPAS
ncbi:MAG: DUF115 domain-containing protein [Treponema sp.]|jgi:hypothetical protein|nr:DUF115 domain-containing protein [Treponema sp.]